MVDHFSTYLYQKRGFYYFSSRVPKELHHCHAKHRIVLAFKAPKPKSPAALEFTSVEYYKRNQLNGCLFADEDYLFLSFSSLSKKDSYSRGCICVVVFFEGKEPDFAASLNAFSARRRSFLISSLSL